jgi:Skp family chaperone for outer membrane proteins
MNKNQKPSTQQRPGSYAAAAKTQNSNPQQREEVPESLNTMLNHILNALNEIRQEMTQIKRKVAAINTRVEWIESTYEQEVQVEMEATDCLPIEETPTPPKDTNDIREKQTNLQQSINRMESNMSSIINVLGNITATSVNSQIPHPKNH